MYCFTVHLAMKSWLLVTKGDENSSKESIKIFFHYDILILSISMLFHKMCL